MEIKNGLFALPTDEQAIAEGCYIDQSLPDKIIRFANEFCTIQSSDYSGQPGRPLRLLEWQIAIVRTLYGWRRPSGALRFRYCSCWMGRRQGKSMLCALLATFFSLTSPRCKIPIIASTKDEARAVFDRCHDFVRCNKDLTRRCKTVPSHKTIRDKRDFGEIQVLACEKVGSLGKGVQLAIYDEVAAWPAHQARDVLSRMHDSLKDKIDAVEISISTPQHDLTSVGYEKFLLAEAVLNGEKPDTSVLPVIYQANPETYREDIEGALRAALPSLGITTPLETYLTEWNSVRGTVDEPAFLVFNLGLWVSSPTVWIPNSFWEACNQPSLNEQEFYYGQYDNIAVGMDWGASYDLTAYTIVIQKGQLFYLFPRYFIPASIAQERTKLDKVPYTTWQLNPKYNLYFTAGDVVDAFAVIAKLKEDQNKFGFKTVRFDKTKMALVDQQLQREGFNCVSVSTGVTTMAAAFEKLERLIRGREIRHDNNPISNWCLANCMPKKTQDKVMVVKSGDRNKIDFVDATAIALTHWLDNQEVILPEGQKWAFGV